MSERAETIDPSVELLCLIYAANKNYSTVLILPLSHSRRAAWRKHISLRDEAFESLTQSREVQEFFEKWKISHRTITFLTIHCCRQVEKPEVGVSSTSLASVGVGGAEVANGGSGQQVTIAVLLLSEIIQQ